ncbi:MAG TPA: hypothetical protein VMI35_04205 [Puia sp.]|nr:hypothetical protein [Puia sp.]
MKKHFISAISKLTLGVLLFTCVAATNVQAASGNEPNAKTGEIKFIGTSDDAVLFKVAYDNPTGAKFSVIVLDEDGTQLFQEVYNDKKFEKRFKLPKMDMTRLTFIIRNFKDADLKQNFEIDTHLVEDVVVTKL